MINVKNTEPRYTTGKKVITVKGAYLNENNIIVDDSGAVGEQLRPEIPSGVSTFDFKISFDIDDDNDIIPPNKEEFENSKIPDGYEGLTF